MSASQNNLSLIVNQQDTNGVNLLNRLVGAITFAGVDGQWTVGSFTDTSPHSQTFPSMITTVLQLYIKNTHATATLAVTWTPTTGAPILVQTLSPGGVISFWNTTSTSPIGITALSLQANTIGTTFEMFLGG
jgi:hypothetical protein